MMKRTALVYTVTGLMISGSVAAALAPDQDTTARPALTPAEITAGWQLLFDGQSTQGWKGYRRDGFPDKGWVVEDGCLRVMAGGGGGDIITTGQYGDFELSLEWKAAPRANSGIMYRVLERHGASWQTGPEYQILDDHGHNLAPSHIHSAGSLYDLYPPSEKKVLKPTGEFNTTRIRLHKNRLEHWLNDVLLVEVDLSSDEWKEKIAGSKFRSYEGFGVEPRGHIALQDHGDDVWFRNIRIRDLDTPMPGEIQLFDGRTLNGWTSYLRDENAKMTDVWSVKDGVLICKGQPIGYLRTEADYKNFVLKLEWRWNPETKATGNSGVLVRMIGEDKVWPKSVEAQLQADSAGDFWGIGEFTMTTDPERTRGRNARKTHHAERPAGEWNAYEIIVDQGQVILKVNGQEVNRAWDVEEIAGKICLQSEGQEIHFRNIRLAPIFRITPPSVGTGGGNANQN